MSMKLIILGLLMEGDKHPYEIQQIMKHRNMDKYIHFQKGSLYYSFERLTKEGFIEVSEVVRDRSRPDRTVHRITESGRNEFQTLLYAQYAKLEPYYNPIYAALAFIKHGDEKKIIEILAGRMKMLEGKLLDLKKFYAEDIAHLPPAQLHIMMAGIEHMKTELAWMRNLYSDAVEGKLRD